LALSESINIEVELLFLVPIQMQTVVNGDEEGFGVLK
jgi:hypothetical protein